MIELHVSRRPRWMTIPTIALSLAALAAVAIGDRGWCADPPIIVAPPSEETPKFGDYVYVEELPEAILRPAPVYPEEAKRAGIAGTVMIQVLVGKDGRVRDTRIVKSIPMLDQAAIDCARQWVFKPALAKGQPVAVWVAVPVRFGDGTESPSSSKPSPPRPELRAQRGVVARASLGELLQRLRSRGAVVPSDEDAILREKIIRAARRDPPEVSRLALESVQRALAGAMPAQDRLRDLALALDAAPWWAEPYREIGVRLMELGRRAEARVCLELYLVAEPDAHDWEFVRLMLNDLRRQIIDSN